MKYLILVTRPLCLNLLRIVFQKPNLILVKLKLNRYKYNTMEMALIIPRKSSTMINKIIPNITKCMRNKIRHQLMIKKKNKNQSTYLKN